MPTIDSALLQLGQAASKALFASWLRGRTPGARPDETIGDLLRRRVPDSFQRRRAQRQLDQVADQVIEQLQKFFKSEFNGIPEHEVIAATLLVRDLFNNVETDASFLLSFDLDPTKLGDYLRRSGADKIAAVALSEAGSFVFGQVLRETAAYVVELFTVMPTFTAAVYKELLRRETSFATMVEQALAKLPAADKQAQDSGAEDRQFETDYRRSIAGKLDRLEIFGVTLSEFSRRYSLSVAYISLSVADQKQHDPDSISQQLQSPDAISTLETGEPVEASFRRVEDALGYTRQRAFIYGEAGSGKTTLLQWLSVMAARKEFSGALKTWNDRIPVYLPLRRYASSNFPRPEQFLDLVLPNLVDRMPQTWISRLLRSGRGLLLLDGVDELPGPKRDDFMRWFVDLINDFPEMTVIATSRPGVFETDWPRRQEMQSFELQPMSLRDIKALIDHWHFAVAKDIDGDDELASLGRFRENLKAIMDERRPIRLLATNPLMCALICALHYDRRTHLPRDRIELYRIALEMLLERRDKERRIPERSDIDLTYREKELILEDIAYWLIRNGQSDATIDATISRLENVLSHIPGIQRSPTRVLSYLLERSGVLRSPMDGHIDFLHRSFQEFLAAKAAVEGSDMPLLIQNAIDDQWREVIILAAGHARPNEQEILIRGLLDHARSNRRNKHRLYLLAMSCLETSTQISPKLRTEVQRALKRVVPPKNQSDAVAIAAAGTLAIPFLSTHSNLEPEIVATCVHALALIGDEDAMRSIRDYANDRRSIVAKEVIRSWSLFSADEYARKVLSHSPLDRGALELIDSSYIDYLSLLTRLRRVRAEGLKDDALRKLGALPRVVQLNLANVVIDDFSWLTNEHLQVLSFENSEINSWEGLGSISDLRRFSIRDCTGQMSGSLQGSGKLESVLLHRIMISSLRFLKGRSDSLRSLSVVECANLTSLEGAGVLNGLQELTLEDNSGLVSLGELQGLQKLRRVTIRGGNISDLSPLEEVPNLEQLRLDRYREYPSLKVLSGRQNLKIIYLD